MLMKKPALYVLLFACLIITIYSAYLLFNNHSDPIIGTIVLAISIVVLLWNWSLAKKRRRRINIASIIGVSLLVALLGGTTSAYAGFEPMSSAKDKVINWVNTEAAAIIESMDKTTSATTGLNLSSDYSKTYPAYEQDLGGGLKLYSKIPIAPPIKVWNYKIQTSSRVYYAVKVEETSEGVTMVGFWTTEGPDWKFKNDQIFMSYKAYGNIQISKAPTYEIR